MDNSKIDGANKIDFHFTAIPKREEDFQESKPFNMWQQTQQEAHFFPQHGDFMPADFQSNRMSMISSDGIDLYLPLQEQQPSSPEFVTAVNSSRLANGNLKKTSNLCDIHVIIALTVWNVTYGICQRL